MIKLKHLLMEGWKDYVVSTNFVDKMIDSGRMNILGKKYRIEFFEEYADVIHKLFSMVKPSIPGGIVKSI